jgi:hypothetical protein
MSVARLRLAGLAVTLVTACGSNHPPKLQPIADQTAAVGVELSFDVRATDSDGDTIKFDFAAPGLPDIKTRATPATLTSFADGVAIFRWTPQAGDRNAAPYAFDFKASDGHATTTETVQITVSDAAGGTAPVFRQPLGTGTTLELDTNACIDVPIVVEDTDSTEVMIAQEQPLIEGAMLTADGPFTATWHWCPTDAQVAAQDRYMLVLSADDGTNPKTLKSYLIVLRKTPPMNCPGMAPAVMHTPPAAQSTVMDIAITATITDDIGVKSAILYYSTNPPGTPPDVTTMDQVPMTMSAGTPLSGTWSATIPNPVAASAAGAKMTIYYIIEAKDNDDPMGTCDHLVDAPATGTYTVDVTNPGAGRGSLMACAACSSDNQCSDMVGTQPAYDCIVIGSTGSTFCARECSGNPPCPTGYNCSTGTITSVNGKVSRFCRPTSGSCAPASMTCVDDMFEPDDTAAAAATLMPMSYSSLVFCPIGTTGANEDWYTLAVTQDSIVTATMKLKEYFSGQGYEDLDLELNDGKTTTYDTSLTTTNTEYVTACVPAAAQKAYLNVFTLSTPPIKATKYDLTMTRVGPDAHEGSTADTEDNDANTAYQLGAPGTVYDQNICGSEDWFWQYLTDGQKLVVQLIYTARKPKEALDVRLYRDNPTPSSVKQVVPAGSPIDGGERLEYAVPDGGTNFYYVVVGGHDHDAGANTYELQVTSLTP